MSNSLVALYALAGYRIMPGLQQIYHSIAQIRYNTPALDILLKDLKNSTYNKNITDGKLISLPKIKKKSNLNLFILSIQIQMIKF